MKRLFTLILALIFMLSMATTAFADIIWIPDNLFLNQNMDECPRCDRCYRAVTEVTVYRSPEDSTVMWTIPEGESAWVYYTYEDASGNLWGCVEDFENGKTGWIPLAYTELVYDYISFEEDYGHLFEIPDEPVPLDESYAGQEVIFWDYPGSNSFYTRSVEADYMPTFDRLYTDTLGREWGYVGYYMGFRNLWVCITDATADYETLYPAGSTPEVSVTDPSVPDPTLPTEEIKPATQPPSMGLTVAIIGCVCITIVLLTRKKKSR